MKPCIAFLLLISLAPSGLRAGDQPPARRLRDGDRVILLGGGFIEQERLHCFLETRLLRHHPRGGLLVRNLGWGGDTVRGSARTGGFQNPEGFARLLREVTLWKPTVIFIGYGMNESFAGQAGIADFVKDYQALLDKLTPLKARMILLAPTYHEPLGPPYPDPALHNDDLKAYGAAIRGLAQARRLDFIDLFAAMAKAKNVDPKQVFTTNGIQPSAAGYALIARAIEGALDYPTGNGWRMTVSATGVVKQSSGAKHRLSRTRGGLRLDITEETLAVADPLAKQTFHLSVWDLPEGTYALKMDGREIVRASADQWERGIAFAVGDEKLRQAIIVKNDLFYRRWRPFNDHSRHFDFLKGDFSLYDKAIAEQERVIDALLAPRSYVLELVNLGK